MGEWWHPIGYGPRQRADRPWGEYPLGTRALALMGGHWLKTDRGWQWMPNGSTWPTPGGDAFDVMVPIIDAPPHA